MLTSAGGSSKTRAAACLSSFRLSFPFFFIFFAHRLNLQIVAGENEDGTPVAIETASKLGARAPAACASVYL